MDKIVYLAVAGSGKTYDLCNSIDEDKKNLIIAFTNQNIKNIQRELIKRFGYIPYETNIITFDSFIYQDFIMPFEHIAWNKMGRTKFENRIETKGVCISAPPPQQIKNKGRYFSNPKYIKDAYIEHYVNEKSRKYYCRRMSKLINKCKIREGIIPLAVKRLELHYDNLYIDEFQDFRDDDYKLLNEIVKRIDLNCYLYGDFYQHSVSGVNNSGLPFNTYDTYDNFKQQLENEKYTVVESKLINSRRCTPNICRFIRESLNINIYSNNNNEGDLIYLEKEEEIIDVLEDNNIIKLFYNNSKKQPCKAINWGYSKGDTYDETCIILPKNLNLNSKINKNKYYVALTRSRGNVYIIEQEKYQKYLDSN